MSPETAETTILQDALTGLGNRRALLAALREQVPAGQGAIVLLDLDGFRAAAGRLTRESADRLLVEVTDRLRAASDVLSLLYRYASDSFALLLPVGGRDEAAAAAERLREAVAASPFVFGPQSVRLTASASAAAFPVDGRSPAALIESAERALLIAKTSGRNRVAVSGRLDPAKLAEIGVFRGLPCPVLVGRAAEQSRLRQMLRDVKETGPATALILGAPGLGKTRLVRELGVWARAQHAILLAGTAREERAGFPYALMAEQIDGLIENDPDVIVPLLEKLEPEHRAALSVVLHRLPTRGPLPEIELPQYARLVFEAFNLLVDGLARTAPILAVADEAEHADDPSFQILRGAIARRLPLMTVVVGDWDEETFSRTAASDFLREAGVTPARLDLAPMPAEEARQVVRAILPEADLAEDQVERLIGAAKGNPLYLEEVVRGLLLRGRLRLDQGRWKLPRLEDADLPPTLEDAVKSVVSALPTRANSLLLRAAVLGARVDSDLLSEVAGQEETELLDLLDEVRRSRLLLMSESGEDLLSFPAAHARRLRLASSDAKDRREIHGRVGVVQEARHGGDVAHIADELAYHYGRAGLQDKARHFGEIARKQADLLRPPIVAGARRQRIPPVTDALSEEATGHAHAVLRHFLGVLKVGRLYPQWSQVGSQFVSQLRAALEGLLASGPGLTVASGPQGLTLNGAAAPEKLAAEFGALMDERLVESITILSGFDPEKLDVLLRGFADPIDRMRAAPDLWDRFLNREGLESIDIVQKAYQAREVQRVSALHGDKPVPEEHLPALRDSVRALKAAVDSLKLYPPGHPLVEESAGGLVRQLTDLLGKIDALTFATSDGEFVVNGMPADAKFFADAGAFLAHEIQHRDLKSVSVWRGVGEDEIRALVSYLSMSAAEPGRNGDADAVLQTLTHVAIGSRQYERAEEGSDEFELKPAAKPIRSELRAREHLARPYERFLAPDLEAQFHVLVEALAYGFGRPLAEQLVQRLGAHFHDKDLAHRTQALQILTRAMAFASPMTRQLEVRCSADPLRKRLGEDAHPAYFRAAANVLPVWIPAAATTDSLRELADLSAGTLRKRADATDTPPEIAAVCESALQLIPQSRSYDAILSAVRKNDADIRKAAVQILVSVGGPAMEKLVDTLAEESDASTRLSMAKLLSPHADLMGPELSRVLSNPTNSERLGRLLAILEPLLSPSLAHPLQDLIEKGGPEARGSILATAEKWPKPLALPILRRLVGHPEAANRDTGLDLATRMKLTELGAEVGRLLEGAEDERLIARCCAYFEVAPNPAIVPQLIKVAQRKPRLFGMVKGFAPATRAAAVNALAAHKSHQAEEVVAAAQKDAELKELVRKP